MSAPLDPPRLDPRTDIGQVHLKVAELDRAIGSYRDVLDPDDLPAVAETETT